MGFQTSHHSTDWGEAYEVVFDGKDNEHSQQEAEITFQVPEGAKSFAVAITDAGGHMPMRSPDGSYVEVFKVIDSVKCSVSKNENSLNEFRLWSDTGVYVHIEADPEPGKRIIKVHGGSKDNPSAPFAVQASLIRSAPKQQLEALRTSRNCKWCKRILKALAAGGVAAAIAKLAPTALTMAIAGLISEVAREALRKMLEEFAGDTIDEVAERLCKHMGICA